MFIRMTKVLLTLGLMTAAGSSSAFYITGGGSLNQNGYCARLDYGNGTYLGILKQTMQECEDQVRADLLAANGGLFTAVACHMCVQKFKVVPETAVKLPTGLVLEFFDRSRALREQFHIDEYERALQELQRSMSPKPKP